ncbi:MAG: histidinol-phosphate aminotransferase family protein, partial [Oscillospiraceae bacterium]|nr:histidinol-phosphate aminotransferase family protein [Oscillospiraceae bacterium]
MYILSQKARSFTPYDPITGNYRVRLDANESFLLPTEADRALMAEAAAAVAFNRYPDPLASGVCGAFAALYGLSPELVTAGNGSDELIFVLMSAFLEKGDRVMPFSPDFAMYRFYADVAETPALVIPKKDDMSVDIDAVIALLRREPVRMLIFSNPCNPTSLGISAAEALRLVEAAADTLVVVDEAYMDFWDQSLLPRILDYDNLVILRTCSKALGMAALRLGFAVANPAITAVLRAAKSPYNVNAVTQAMAEVALRNAVYHKVYPELLVQSRRQLEDGLRHNAGILRVLESRANFVFAQVPDAAGCWNALAERGICVRRFGDRWLRITAGTEWENNQVVGALALYFNQEG